ncbi:carboxypeptidase Y-deficient [Cryomyces antarcticus]|uniref:Carboxypeptidase Y-deficient n=1 Tax=Cryomyces antarcticus TaxID=329879 RepID=A0ABR0KU47_9PEZI|nr:carboxypeptidase Y-deficient [Cryomyces antarcticus]KAK5130720.1 carboxypeptidase Y-deficient [Cryomyces antarcticus]
MASRRALGGGRILGSGRSLSPAVPPQQHKRNTSLLSPSGSSVSLSSQTSDTPISTDNDDLSSRIALESDNAAAAGASSRMVCPICNEEMVGTLPLGTTVLTSLSNLVSVHRHLDDAHKNLEEVEQDEVKTWFKQQMTKAKKFQPLAVLNQKLKGLDVFESNDALIPPSSSSTSSHVRNPTTAPAASESISRPDPDEVVTRSHWQRSTGHDFCSEPSCGKRLNSANGNVNCRHCGKLFCEDHTMYQMRLSRSAQHEPVRGFWCRVCETCYKSREGYNDHNGLVRDHTNEFAAIRRKTVDKAYLEVSRLEKRLTKLTQLLTNPHSEQFSGGASLFWSLNGGVKAQQRAMEQSVVTWEDDTSVSKCPFCQQEFSQYTFRRHHCRLCGRVVCGDVKTECSTEVGLNVASEKASSQISLDIRMCKECRHTIFSSADFARELAHRPPDQRAYENLTQFERGIRLMLPKFQKLLVALQTPDTAPTPAQLADATKVRKRLMDAFTQYDVAARRIRDLPTESPTQARLQKAIHAQAMTFLHLHMLPLKSLPKIMKHTTPHPPAPNTLAPSSAANGRPASGALASIRYNDRPSSSRASSSSSAAVSALEAEEKELRERLIVLEEQKFLVSEMIADANRRRKFDEVAALAGNVEDLGQEIDRIQGQLEGMDFEGVYGGIGDGS